MCFSACDRNFQQICFIHLVLLEFKNKTDQWFLLHLLHYFSYDSVGFYVKVLFKIWLNEKRLFPKSRFCCRWEKGGMPRCLKGKDQRKEEHWRLQAWTQSLSASHFSPAGASLWTGPVGLMCHILTLVPLIREAHCISIGCTVHTGPTLSLFETD